MANGEPVKVLIVDDDASIRSSMSRIIESMGLHVETADTGEKALKMSAGGDFDMVFLDVMLPDLTGPEIVKHIRKNTHDAPIMMMTAYPAVEDAVDCMKSGVVDYLIKPFRMKDVEEHVSRCLALLEKRALSKADGFQKDFKGKTALERIVGESKQTHDLKEAITLAAQTDSTILITGESGTGKDLTARAVHELSARADRDFVTVDCSAIVETLLESELFGHARGAFTGATDGKSGLLELANHGTFFFDEISNLSMNTQSKILRVIQEREFMKVGGRKRQKLDIRIISASNIDLERAVNRGTFRNDLYYRINVVPIHIPSLRERSDDIPLLLKHYLKRFLLKFKRDIDGFSEEAMDALLAYPYPGNIRELKHLVEQIVVLHTRSGSEIGIEDLPPAVTHRKGTFKLFSAKDVSLEEIEKRYIGYILGRTRGLRGQAAEILGINRKTLTLKIKKYGLAPDVE